MLALHDKVAVKDSGKVGEITRKKAKLAWIKLDDGSVIKQPLDNLTPVKRRRTNAPTLDTAPDAAADVNQPTGAETFGIPTFLKRAPVPVATTDAIQIRIEGMLRGSRWTTIQRAFPLISGAQAYLQQFSLHSIEGKTAKCYGDADLWTNYEIKKIMDGAPPKGPLPNILSHYRPSQQREIKMPTQLSEAVTSGGDSKLRPRKARVTSGDVVTLKQLLPEGVDEKAARVKLRKLVKQGKITKPEGRWEWAKDEAARIAELLASPATKKTAPAAPQPPASAAKTVKKSDRGALMRKIKAKRGQKMPQRGRNA